MSWATFAIWAMSSSDPNVRIYQTNERQGYHTDSCDIVGLLCLQTAKAGGLSSLVSSVTIFNEMRRQRPDLLSRLFEPIATDRRGEVPEGKSPTSRFRFSTGTPACSPPSTIENTSIGTSLRGDSA